jgi:hypothetical protein
MGADALFRQVSFATATQVPDARNLATADRVGRTGPTTVRAHGPAPDVHVLALQTTATVLYNMDDDMLRPTAA